MKQIIIEQSGRTVVRSYTDTEVNLRREVAATIADTGVVVARRVAAIEHPGDGERLRVSAGITSAGHMWVIPLQTLRLLCGIRSREGVVMLNFEGTEAVAMLWTPPRSMRLVLACDLYPDNVRWYVDKCYLMALDEQDRAWRLPIANVFDDSSLCTGNFQRFGNSALDVVVASYNQFRASPWNADLYATKKDDFKLMTDALFRWSASDSGFHQLTDNADRWSDFCFKISSDIVNRVLEVVEAPQEIPDLEDEEDGDQEGYDHDEP